MYTQLAASAGTLFAAYVYAHEPMYISLDCIQSKPRLHTVNVV